MNKTVLAALDQFIAGRGQAPARLAWVPTLSVSLAGLAVLVLLAGVTSIGPSSYTLNLIGQIATFALLALSLDLIWGYAGILSLGHGLYFAIGGYLVAMHMVKVSFLETNTPPDFMLFMGWKELPAYYFGTEYFIYILLAAIVITSIIAFLFGYISFRSRISGVYFSIITQALVYVAMLLFFRNDTGFGGNNGMTGFTSLFGLKLASPSAVALLSALSIFALAAVLYGCNRLVRSRFGHMLVAIRDDEGRLRFLGYETLWIKILVWVLSALIAALAGMLYVPQVGIINPRVLSPDLSLEIAVWVAIGGRCTLVGAVLGAGIVNILKFILTASAPDLWPFILSLLVLGIAVALPNGLLSAPEALRRVVQTRFRRPIEVKP
jgi:urea transport system permease protein